MNKDSIINQLKSYADEENRKGMAKYGINTANALGVKVEKIREIARQTGKDDNLASELWDTGIHEARILATIIADPENADSDELDKWASDLDSWDLCDQFCSNLVSVSPHAKMKIIQWCIQDENFVKRAGFATMANYVRKNNDIPDKDIEGYFSLIINESEDKRNYVRKAVSWALRSIGKTNIHYNRKAVKISKMLKDTGTKPAKETAQEALKDLQKRELLRKLSGKDNTQENN